MDEVHLPRNETMVETTVCWDLQGNQLIPGLLLFDAKMDGVTSHQQARPKDCPDGRTPQKGVPWKRTHPHMSPWLAWTVFEAGLLCSSIIGPHRYVNHWLNVREPPNLWVFISGSLFSATHFGTRSALSRAEERTREGPQREPEIGGEGGGRDLGQGAERKKTTGRPGVVWNSPP